MHAMTFTPQNCGERMCKSSVSDFFSSFAGGFLCPLRSNVSSPTERYSFPTWQIGVTRGRTGCTWPPGRRHMGQIYRRKL